MFSLCQCGCGKEVTNEKNRFLKGHCRGMLGKKQSTTTINKLVQRHIGKKLSDKTKLKISKTLMNHPVSDKTKKKLSIACKGRKYSKDYKLKMSEVCKGKKLTDKQCLEISKRQTGKFHSEKSKLKMRLSRIRYIETHFCDGNPMIPCIGKNETLILDQIQTNINEKIIRNSSEIAYKIGKFPDGYIPKYNIVIEIDESFHYKNNNELKDIDKERELLISSNLVCLIYRIKEKNFLTNSEEEIQKFKNFLVLLDEGRN